MHTKVFFNFVVLSSFLLVLAFSFFRKNSKHLKVLAMLGGGYLLFAPFLVYTYMITGKAFYTGTQGGEMLYHRATPFENEYGNWFGQHDIYRADKKSWGTLHFEREKFISNHKPFYDELVGLTFVQRDSAFKARAIEYIQAHPKKYLVNTFANASRLIFHFPFSYRTQDLSTLGYLIPNIFIVVLIFLMLYPALLSIRRLPYELLAWLIFTLIYLMGIVLLSGKGRNFILAVPGLVLFIIYMLNHVIQITIGSRSE